MFELYLLIAIIAAALLGLSQVFLKKGLDRVPSLKLEWEAIKRAVNDLMNNYFITAVVLGLGGGLSHLVALSMGKITIVQPLMSFASFVAVALGVLWLDETLSKTEYCEIGLILGGIILLSVTL
ncbi:hypothetical protein AKJ40_03420 [candidate division MSBL1 archaeon SCGC-AAA259M10]|uniref:Uncharacterized protein n=3 Tax=candidate division MSBL1 TaxID=215777 RepID=A0A133U887_9EURY|nr:hypothetical protein AKJ62_00980 [candidate division MSBL1 archaeon SCGC-AAA259D14]KXA93386.1 hypothetical protein AKJ66_02190 [candidate division MSBL1 archaeon SCGC-AAA259E22]KXA99323.1 hypothetical protein AKJ40_03420 [candidate division MSBL1 archaeon SCGC-AAA259M10]